MTFLPIKSLRKGTILKLLMQVREGSASESELDDTLEVLASDGAYIEWLVRNLRPEALVALELDPEGGFW